MGKVGHTSKKGIGEIDDAPRKRTFLVYFTVEDMKLLNALSQLLRKSKNQIIVESFRNYAQYYTTEIPEASDSTD